MSWMHFILPLVLSSFTGWFVIWLIIKLLFRPYKQINIIGFKIQGIIPANQQVIAERIGRLLSEELFSFKELGEKATDKENFNKLKPEIETHIDSFLRERLKDTFPMLSMLIGDKTINQLKTAFMLELESLFPVIMKNYINSLEEGIDLEKTAARKIAGFSLIKTEEYVQKTAGRLLIKVQLLGAAIGLLMGFVHIFVNSQLFT